MAGVVGGIGPVTRALGEFGAKLMVAGAIPGKTQTLASAIYLASECGDNVTATVLVIFTVVLGLASIWALSWRPYITRRWYADKTASYGRG